MGDTHMRVLKEANYNLKCSRSLEMEVKMGKNETR
jgi:hypothetical protein